MVNEGDDSYIGKQIKNYTILHKLGSGRFACVYLARNYLNEHVAIKLLNSEYNRSENQQHFLREARFLQELKHQQYILPILEYGESEDTPYIIVEYAPGGTLRERINTCYFTAIDDALTVLMQIGEALHTVHENGIIHCDLKPENILFNDKGDAVVADFGIAVQSEGNKGFFGLPRGTCAYMAPEQFDGMFTKKGDQYSLGCIAYELLTGSHPFECFLPFDPHDRRIMKERHKNTKARDPGEFNSAVPSHIRRSILRSMEKKPSKRHASIAAFIRSLQSSTSLFPQSVYYFVRPLDTPATSTSSSEGVLSPVIPPHNPEVSSIGAAVYEIVQLKANHSRVLLNSRHERSPGQTLPKNAYSNKRDDEKLDQKSNLDTEPPTTASQDNVDKKAGIASPRNPLETYDLQLPGRIKTLISPSLKDSKLTFCGGTQWDEVMHENWKYTGIAFDESGCSATKNNPVPQYALVYIPAKFFNENAIFTILSPFSHWTVIIFSDELEDYAPRLDRRLKKEGEIEHITWELLIKKHIDELKGEKPNVRISSIRDYLKLKNLPKPLPQVPIEVPDDDIGKLQKFSTRFIIKNDIQVFLQTWASDDLKKTLVGSINFQRAPESVASDIISRLNKPPFQPVSEDHTLLGEFLCRLMNKPDFVSDSDTDATKIRSVIRKCRLGPPTCSCSQP